MAKTDKHFQSLNKPIYYSYVDESMTTRVSELLLESIRINSGEKNVDFKKHSKRDLDSLSSGLILEMFLQDLERN